MFTAKAESLPGFPTQSIPGKCAEAFLAAIVSLPYLWRQPRGCWRLLPRCLCCVNTFLTSLGMRCFKSLVFFLMLAKQVMGVAVSCWDFGGNVERQKAIIRVRMCAEHFYCCYSLFYHHASCTALQRRKRGPLAKQVSISEFGTS